MVEVARRRSRAAGVPVEADLRRRLAEAGFEVVARLELSAALGGCLDLAEDYLHVTRRVGASSR